MDPIENPFSPGAGTPPPELVGRDPILYQVEILLSRVKLGRSEKSMLLTGLRGVGKTVLLNEIEKKAKDKDYQTVLIAAHEQKTLGALIAPPLRKLLFELDRMSGMASKVKRALAVLRSFVGGLKLTVHDVSIGIDIEPEKGSADSGDIEVDLPELFLSIGEAALDRKCPVIILIDEIQYLNQKELGALIMAMHKIQQRQLPIVLIGAGLPILPGLAGESKSYAERLFNFPDLGALSKEDTIRALRQPAKEKGVDFEPAAIEEISRLTKGYPYFLQEWGYQAWNLTKTSSISLPVVKEASDIVVSRLDQNFFRVRFDRLTPSEKNFMRAMASLGHGPYRFADVANILSSKTHQLSPIRAKLIKKGMIYSPAYGDIAFTVPLFDAFMIRVMPNWKPPSV
jgi:AAA ATPase domain